MTAFAITQLKPELIFIKWFHNPDKQDEDDFLDQLRRLLDDSETLLYFISDLREGRIVNIQTISRLSALTRHRQWGGSTAFSQDAASQMFSRTFRSLSLGANSNNEIHKTLKDSLAFLEALKPGITENIAWDEIVSPSE